MVTLEVYKQIVDSKLQNFDYETMENLKEAQRYLYNIMNNLRDYYDARDK